ncbi:MAG: extracellular solute-binding protein [Burkholderiaceae bacterium]
MLKQCIARTLIGAAGLLAFGLAQAQTPTFASVLEGAKREGALSVSVSSPGLPATHKALFEAFNKRFNLNLKAEWTPASSVSTGTRIASEYGRGTGAIDIVGAGGAEEAAVLIERGILKPYPWAEVFGKELPQIGEVANRAIPDLRGITLPVLDAVYGIAWNTDLIKDEEVPSSYEALLDPRWKGKMTVNAFYLIPLDSLAFVIGRDKTLDMARKLLENKPVLERGTPAVSRAISVGQTPFGVTTFHAAARSGTADKPQKFKLFSDFIPISPTYVYVPENAPHPNAARLFAAWLVTEGIPIANKTELIPRAGDQGSVIAEMIKAQQTKTGARTASPRSLMDVKEGAITRKAITDMMTSSK